MTPRDALTCPECGGEVWDLPHGHKLAKCWACGLAFDTMADEDDELEPGYVRLEDETLERLERAGVQPARIAAMRETRAGVDYVGADCTLDGQPATICGRNLPFAIVAQYPAGADRQKVLPGLCVEFAWPTVARIMAAGGGFRT